MVGTLCTGIAQAAIDASVKYAQERMQFGKPIGSFQMIQEMIVDMVTETEASRLLSFRALDLLDAKQKCRWQSSLAKAYATEAAVRTTSRRYRSTALWASPMSTRWSATSGMPGH